MRNWFEQDGAGYARHRPDYPSGLAEFLASRAPGRRLAVDVGCGSGQFTAQLAAVFDTVIGIDPSGEQLAFAAPHERVVYVKGPAEALPLDDHCADLVCAAQAAHWFDLPRFYFEARRVATPGAVLALVTYGAARFAETQDAALDVVLQRFHSGGMGRYWPAERQLVEDGYAGMDFPFASLPAPAIDIVRDWTVEALLGYVSTWSAVRRAAEAGQGGLLTAFADELRSAWGDPEQPRRIRWPIAMRLGRLN